METINLANVLMGVVSYACLFLSTYVFYKIIREKRCEGIAQKICGLMHCKLNKQYLKNITFLQYNTQNAKKSDEENKKIRDLREENKILYSEIFYFEREIAIFIKVLFTIIEIVIFVSIILFILAVDGMKFTWDFGDVLEVFK